MRPPRLLTLTMLLLLLVGCVPASPRPTPTATRTPRPTPTLTPSPTPTPAFPVTVGCGEEAPAGACAQLQAIVEADPAHFRWMEGGGQADLQLRATVVPTATVQPVGSWVYAAAVPFFALEEETTAEGLRSAWAGEGGGPLLVRAEDRPLLTAWWGEPSPQVEIITGTLGPEQVGAEGGVALLPFDRLVPQWKVLAVDGASPLWRPLPPDYALAVPLYLVSTTRADAMPLLGLGSGSLTNRDETKMTVVMMTGVTAMTRATAQLMETKGITYPATSIAPWFEDADFVHVSNEVSFRPDCVAEGHGTMSFCSNDRYIALLEAIHTNIVELTGNHLADKGTQWITHSLEMYAERGWQWFGGGYNLADATRPLTITHHGNRIAFLGCNPIGPAYDWATETSPGSAPCDYDRLRAQIAALHDEGYQVIVTQQYLETYEYVPTPQQIHDFRSLASAGATVVQGSQAHQAQTLEFYGDSFIHYGLGNFFFDQMWSLGTRQEFVNRLVFYDGRLVSIHQHTALLEEYGRPRPMTAEERRDFLRMIYDLSPRGQ